MATPERGSAHRITTKACDGRTDGRTDDMPQYIGRYADAVNMRRAAKERK